MSTDIQEAAGPERGFESRIAEAASDYKLGFLNRKFAEDNGGVDKLRQDLFDLVDEWEYLTEDEGPF